MSIKVATGGSSPRRTDHNVKNSNIMAKNHSNDLTAINQEFRIREDGVAIASIRGTARLAGVSHTALTKLLGSMGGNLEGSKLAVTLTNHGFEGGNLVDSGIPDTAVSLIIEYYAFDAGRYCNDTAKSTYRAFASIGIRTWIKQELGVTDEPAAPPSTYLEALKALVASEEEKERLKAQQAQLAAENELLEEENEQLAEAVDELFDYSSIVRIAKFNSVNESMFNWRTLKAACRRLGLEIKKVPCPRYVTKNLYPHAAWRSVYPDAALPEATTIRLAK